MWSQSGPAHSLLYDPGQVRYTTLWTSLCSSMNHGLGTTCFQRGLSTLIFYDFIIKDLIELLFPGSSHLCDIYKQESKYKAKGANCSKKECPRVFKRTSIRLASYHLTCLPGTKCLRRSSQLPVPLRSRVSYGGSTSLVLVRPQLCSCQ